MPQCTLHVARTEVGYLIRVEGAGTSQDSFTLATFVNQYLLAERRPSVTIDLSACRYLDSTFLGCLLTLQKKCHDSSDSRFLVVADNETRKKLLSATRLDTVLEFADSVPRTEGGFVTMNAARFGTKDHGRHVMESHLALARVPSRQAKLFQEIADQLARELEDRQRFKDEGDSLRETV